MATLLHSTNSNNSSNSSNSSNVNNLNIFTFIKDIYQSLKHIDQYFSIFNKTISTRLTKLEDNQNIVNDKLSSIEILLIKLTESSKGSNSLDKNIERELLDKMSKMNEISHYNIMNGQNKIDLKPDELTFANILENNYTFTDINSSLSNTILSNTIRTETLDSLLF